MHCPKFLQRCIILRRGSQRSQNISEHMMAKWRATITLHACTTSCKPELLVNLLKMTLCYSFLLMVHSYIETNPLIVGCLSELSTIFTPDYTTQNHSLSQAALFLIPINSEKSTLTCIHLSIILLLYNTRASKYAMCLHLQRYNN